MATLIINIFFFCYYLLSLSEIVDIYKKKVNKNITGSYHKYTKYKIDAEPVSPSAIYLYSYRVSYRYVKAVIDILDIYFMGPS